jgi:hypothetical protein
VLDPNMQRRSGTSSFGVPSRATGNTARSAPRERTTEDIMMQSKLFGLVASVALAAAGSGVAYAQTAGHEGGSAGQGQTTNKGQQGAKDQKDKDQKGAEQKGQQGQQGQQGFGAGLGGETGRDQNICECPCSTPGAKPRGSFGAGLPGQQGGQPGQQGAQPGQQGGQGSHGGTQGATPGQHTPGTQGTQQGGGGR